MLDIERMYEVTAKINERISKGESVDQIINSADIVELQEMVEFYPGNLPLVEIAKIVEEKGFAEDCVNFIRSVEKDRKELWAFKKKHKDAFVDDRENTEVYENREACKIAASAVYMSNDLNAMLYLKRATSWGGLVLEKIMESKDVDYMLKYAQENGVAEEIRNFVLDSENAPSIWQLSKFENDITTRETYADALLVTEDVEFIERFLLDHKNENGFYNKEKEIEEFLSTKEMQ